MLSTLLTFIFGDAGCRSGTRESTGPGVSGDGSSTRAPSPLSPGASAALGERERRRQRRRLRSARSGVQVRAEAGGGRRGRCAELGGGAARAAGWKREPPTESPGARRPSPLPLRAPPLPPAAESPDGGGGAGAGVWPRSSQTLRRPEATPRVASGL